MNKRTFFQWISLAAAVIAFVCCLNPGSALAVSKSVPYCNGWTAATQTVPAYCPTPGPSNICPGGGTTLCTDLFGIGNYANSPLPAGPIDITPAPVPPATTPAAGLTIVDMGSGYTAPVVTVSDAFNMPGVVPAVCTAVTDAAGSLTGIPGAIFSISCTSGGSGYVAPVVDILDPVACPTPGSTPNCAVVTAKLSATAALAGTLSGGIRKFVDSVPDLKGALATPDTTTFANSDYYEIALVKSTTQMHSDLPPTTVVGYVQFPSGSTSCSATPVKPYQYLGPVILAAKDRPVRVKFTNCLAPGSGGDLFIPADTTYMGAGAGPTTPANTDCTDPANTAVCYQQNRATLHLHGGNTPWISDGTPHQWTVPVGDTAAMYQRGVSTQFVPDMYFVNGAIVPQCSATVTTNCSGGTPVQLPAGATTDSGQGSMTFYWTNQQGGRLMFYHDHAYGTTRLNVYAGEAAGYLVADPAEEDALQALKVPGTLGTLVGGTTAPDLAHLIPLVIQDKTFVPSAAQLAAQDPTWIWGTGTTPVTTANGNVVNGDLWNTHVYPTNQNPYDPNSTNAFGRWDYGVWFVPGQNVLTAAGPGPLGPNTAVTTACTSAAFPGLLLEPTDANKYQGGCPIIPNPTGTPESFMDTPLVNGKAYPVLNVNPEAYRFKILDASNDRSLNLQLYVADPTTVTAWNPLGTDVKMLPAFPSLPLCTKANQLTNPVLGTGLPLALLDGNGDPINGTGLLTNCWPNYGVGTPKKQFMWPADGRDGGVPDPTTAGPPIIQIGTEGGLLPAAVVIPSTPSNYESNIKSVTVTNVSAHGLWVGPAERADVIIDFSKFAGKTLILYNDAPAPAPAFDLRDDYYTNSTDNTGSGGAPSTVVGYGPNTRTIMQINVAAGTGNGTFKLSTLAAGLPAIFATTQPPVVVPEPTYPPASGANSPTTNYVQNFQATDLTFQPAGSTAGTTVVGSVKVNSGGSGYSAATTVTIDPPAGCITPVICTTATATPKFGLGGVLTGITLTNVGAGYGAAIPNVAITDHNCGGAGQPVCGSGASATAINASKIPFELKAIQELFTLDYGRMNATLGTEIPFTTFTNQTTLPFGYTDWATEIVQKDTPQLWYLYHNGVDTHFIHFHLFNVQVINRIGWDGTVRPPEANELGWKDTVRMNPLENILFAIKPITPVVPFPLPDSIRLQDPTMPESTNPDPAISGIDPANGNAAANGQTNVKVNFGWEYVWHCHILGHEENDMMRPMIYQVPPPAPSNLAAVANGSGGVTLSWSDNSASESGFTLQRDTDPAFPAPVNLLTNANASVPNTAFGGTLTYTDTTVSTVGTVYYRLKAVDDFTPQSPLAAPFQTTALASAWAGPVTITNKTATTINAPAITYGANGVVTVSVSSPQVTPVTGTVTLSVDGGAPLNGTLVNGSAIFTLTTPAAGSHTLSANYAAQGAFGASSANGALVVNGASLNITAGNATMAYGGAVPVITPGYSGFVLGQTNLTALTTQPTCSTTATSTSPASPPTYPSACSGAVAPNYTITYVAGTVTVNKAASATTITAHTPNPSIVGQVVTVSFSVAPQFSGTPTGTVTVNASTGQSCTGTLIAGAGICTMSLTPGGARTLTATYAGDTNFLTSVSAAVPQLVSSVSLSTNSLLFGNQLVGTNSARQTITLSNVGASTLPITSITVGAPFNFTTNCGTSLLAGRSCSINMRFSPTTAGVSTATVTITDGDPTSPQSVSLTGTGIAPINTVTPASLAFSSALNVTSASQPVTVTNTGTASMTINRITLGPGQFAQTNTCGPFPATLQIGASCTVNVTFSPTTVGTGTKAATLNVNVAAPATSKSVALTGTVNVPTNTLSPTSLAFGTQTRNTTSPAQPVTVSNTGTAPLTLTNITMAGANAGQFAQTNTCGPFPATLQIGASCTVNVTFRPSSAGGKSATLRVVASAPATTQTASLSGTGQ
jgi:FtsP/CotA-like multicopper oxidase with cupredoxin domain